MNNRIAALAVQAKELSRQIYASLPFEERLADLFTKIAFETVDVLGRYLGAVFLLGGVTEMPDPGPRWDPKHTDPAKAALTLPSDYLRDFGSKLYKTMIRNFHDPEVVEDALQDFMYKRMKVERVRPGTSLKSAESWAIEHAVAQGLDTVRDRRKYKPTHMESLNEPSYGDEGRALEETLEDVDEDSPEGFARLYKELGDTAWKRLMDYLSKHLHPDIPEFIRLQMQGYTNEEIIGFPAKGEPGKLPHYPAPASGYKGYLKDFVYPGGPRGGIPGQTKKFLQSIGEL